MESFLHGIILAAGLILPLGVQNLFVFNQGTVQSSFWKALPAVCTASVCDTLLIVLAVQGVSLFLMKFGLFKMLLTGIGAVFLLYMGWITWNNTAVHSDKDTDNRFAAKQQIVFAATVSLLNPHAVLDTIGVIGTSSVNYAGREKLFFTAACILVSWVWFFSLAATGRILGKKAQFSEKIVLINKLSAVFMWGSAWYMTYNAL
jgi:L-lysine exporter family protein LysE/ArgO